MMAFGLAFASFTFGIMALSTSMASEQENVSARKSGLFLLSVAFLVASVAAAFFAGANL